jgi:hypothetical protein
VLSDPQVERIQRDKLTATGWSIGQVRALGTHPGRELTSPSAGEEERLFTHLIGPAGLAQQQPMFT